MIHCEFARDFVNLDALRRSAQRGRSACTAEAFKCCIRSACVLSLAFVVSACVHFQDYRPEPVSAPMRAEALETRTLDNPRLQMFLAAATGIAASDGANWDLGTLTLALVLDVSFASHKCGHFG